MSAPRRCDVAASHAEATRALLEATQLLEAARADEHQHAEAHARAAKALAGTDARLVELGERHQAALGAEEQAALTGGRTRELSTASVAVEKLATELRAFERVRSSLAAEEQRHAGELATARVHLRGVEADHAVAVVAHARVQELLAAFAAREAIAAAMAPLDARREEVARLEAHLSSLRSADPILDAGVERQQHQHVAAILRGDFPPDAEVAIDRGPLVEARVTVACFGSERAPIGRLGDVVSVTVEDVLRSGGALVLLTDEAQAPVVAAPPFDPGDEHMRQREMMAADRRASDARRRAMASGVPVSQ